MCAPSAPPAPNYAAAAQQTAAGNLAAARVGQYGNMVNQYSPYGKVIYRPVTTGYINTEGTTITPEEYDALKDKKGFSPLERWSQTTTLSPAQQKLFDQSQAINQQLGDVAQSGVDYVRDAMGNPVKQNISLASGASPTSGEMTTGVNEPNLQTSFENTSDRINADFSNFNDRVRPDFENFNNRVNADYQSYVNDVQRQSGANERANANVYQNLNQIQTRLQDPQLLAQETTNALYKANTQYLDPQFQQAQSDLENRLANQGITQGSEAYNRAMQNFGNQKQQAYESARNQAIGGGIQAAQGMFGMNLQGGQFANQALGQQFGQSVTQQQLANAAANQNNQLALANQAAYNAAVAQKYSQGLGAQQAANQAINQMYNQALGAQQAGNQAVNQMYNQNLGAQQAGNQALGQIYAQNLGAADFANQAQMNQFNAALQNAQLNNQVQNQAFAQGLSNAQLQNAASAQDISQQTALQNAPINILNAVRTGQQLNAANIPQVGVSQPGQLATVSGPDMLSAATAQGQYNQGIYNAQSAANSQLMGSLIGAGGMLGGAGIMKFSDIRLKKNIIKLGIHKTLGIGLYTWDYLWGEKGAGVMAQELEQVMPEAVITMPDGFKAVNYSMLGA